jgi:hypothetical protein
LQEPLDEVDRDGSEQCEYPEFVEIMTLSLNRIRAELELSGEQQGPDISFDLMAAAYRSKRHLGGLVVIKHVNVQRNLVTMQELLDEVDRDGSGQCEYPEFVEIMTLSLDRIRAEQERSGERQGPDISFDLMATAYRRKRLMEGLMSGDREEQSTILQMAANQLNEAEARATAAAEAASGAAAKFSATSVPEAIKHGGVGPGGIKWKDLLQGLGRAEAAVVRRLAAQTKRPGDDAMDDMLDLVKLSQFRAPGGRVLHRQPPHAMLNQVGCCSAISCCMIRHTQHRFRLYFASLQDCILLHDGGCSGRFRDNSARGGCARRGRAGCKCVEATLEGAESGGGGSCAAARNTKKKVGV